MSVPVSRTPRAGGPGAPVGVVLAGGAGRRMGGAKAGVVLAGRPLLSYPLAALAAVLEDVAVLAKRGTELPALPPGTALWHEPDEPRHPLAGVVEALRRAQGRAVVVLACDLPLVTADLVRELAHRDARGAVALVARAVGHEERDARSPQARGVAAAPDPKGGAPIQPLCARYEPRALELLAAFDAGGRAVEQVLALEPAVLGVDAALLHNVNDAAQLAQAEALLRLRPGQPNVNA